jgi:hypothetical protein
MKLSTCRPKLDGTYVSPHQPYWEQQPPWGQLPQTVPPLAAPQVPSVVTGADDEAAGAADEVLLPRHGPDWQPVPQ